MISIVHYKNYILSRHHAINNYSMNTKSLIVCADFLVLASIEDKRDAVDYKTAEVPSTTNTFLFHFFVHSLQRKQ